MSGSRGERSEPGQQRLVFEIKASIRRSDVAGLADLPVNEPRERLPDGVRWVRADLGDPARVSPSHACDVYSVQNCGNSVPVGLYSE